MAAWARQRGAVLASDECYLEFGWHDRPVSVLHPSVCGEPKTAVKTTAFIAYLFVVDGC